MAGEDRPCGELEDTEGESGRLGRREEGLGRLAAEVGGAGASASDQALAGAGSRRADGTVAWRGLLDCVGPKSSGTIDEPLIRELATCRSY